MASNFRSSYMYMPFWDKCTDLSHKMILNSTKSKVSNCSELGPFRVLFLLVASRLRAVHRSHCRIFEGFCGVYGTLTSFYVLFSAWTYTFVHVNYNCRNLSPLYQVISPCNTRSSIWDRHTKNVKAGMFAFLSSALGTELGNWLDGSESV